MKKDTDIIEHPILRAEMERCENNRRYRLQKIKIYRQSMSDTWNEIETLTKEAPDKHKDYIDSLIRQVRLTEALFGACMSIESAYAKNN